MTSKMTGHQVVDQARDPAYWGRLLKREQDENRRLYQRNEALVEENRKLRELVRSAQHHVPRGWPDALRWLADAYTALGSRFAQSGTPRYNPEGDSEG